MSNQQTYNTARNNGKTHEEAAGALNVTPEASRMLKSRYNKAGNVSKTLSSSKPRKAKPAPEVVARTAGITATMPTVTKWTLLKINWTKARGYGISILLVLVVIGHAGLVWYDTGQMWGMPGVIGGAVTFAVVLAAVLLASDASKNRTSSSALWFVALIDAAAFFVHVPTFEKHADIGPIETRAFAFFLCGCSFVALYLFRDSKLD